MPSIGLAHNIPCNPTSNPLQYTTWLHRCKHNTIHKYKIILLIRRLSLALKKVFCDWLRQTLNPSELKVSDPSMPELIHTSCRSESSNISLVVLDKESLALGTYMCTLTGWTTFREHVKWTHNRATKSCMFFYLKRTNSICLTHICAPISKN